MEDRKNVPLEHTWDLQGIYKDQGEIERAMEQIEAAAQALAKLAGSLKDAKGLLAALKSYFSLEEMIEVFYSYAMMASDLDKRDTTAQALEDRAQGLYTKVVTAASFLRPEILALPVGQVDTWCGQEPELAPYGRHLQEIERTRAHALDAGGEKLMAMASDALAGPSNVFSMINNADIYWDPIKNEKGETVPMSHGSYRLFLESDDRRVRKEAYDSMFDAFIRQKNTINATYAASVKGDVFEAKARGFADAREAALFPDEMPTAVYDHLLATVESHAGDMGRYLQLRKRILGVDTLHFCDLHVSIAGAWDMRLPYDAAIKEVAAGVAALGDTYGKDLQHAFGNRWLDVYETAGKRSGAYSNGVSGHHPFVLLNYNQTLDNIFTIAHEMGHAMHSFYSSKAQPYPTRGYPIFLAEVASTVNEMLMIEHMLDTIKDKAARAALLHQKIETIRGTVYRQTLFAAFEHESHRMAQAGEPLTYETLCAAYGALYRRYYPGLEVDEKLPFEWMRIPHFYNAFYVYKYATGLSAAVALTQKIRSGEPGALERYLGFLQGGGSLPPLEQLKRAGVDMTTPAPVSSCMQSFVAAVDELESLL